MTYFLPGPVSCGLHAPAASRGLPTEPSRSPLRASPALWSRGDPLGFQSSGLAGHHSLWLGENHTLPGLDLLAGRRTTEHLLLVGLVLAQGHSSEPDPPSLVSSKQKT